MMVRWWRREEIPAVWASMTHSSSQDPGTPPHPHSHRHNLRKPYTIHFYVVVFRRISFQICTAVCEYFIVEFSLFIPYLLDLLRYQIVVIKLCFRLLLTLFARLSNIYHCRNLLLSKIYRTNNHKCSKKHQLSHRAPKHPISTSQLTTFKPLNAHSLLLSEQFTKTELTLANGIFQTKNQKMDAAQYKSKVIFR